MTELAKRIRIDVLNSKESVPAVPWSNLWKDARPDLSTDAVDAYSGRTEKLWQQMITLSPALAIHNYNVGVLIQDMAEELGLSKQQVAEWTFAGVLHDSGKAARDSDN